MKTEAVLNLIAKMITDMILRELDEGKDPLNEEYGYFGVMVPVISVKPCHLKDHTMI
ncbi:hypothetical protein PBAL39_14449 [Pedobacter sp. BAL39]|uniref:hypothetical protein n=1 Tax=Pedobacter sp. BAL39 TaxID=391596 RepID=UPI00015593A4|nr:hypothetical protein [Pedobacter sp. BAL39]EDM37633.1 hypothetical protein PBAL39_14449 [Pedobacter sp. BAL39]